MSKSRKETSLWQNGNHARALGAEYRVQPCVAANDDDHLTKRNGRLRTSKICVSVPHSCPYTVIDSSVKEGEAILDRFTA